MKTLDFKALMAETASLVSTAIKHQHLPWADVLTTAARNTLIQTAELAAASGFGVELFVCGQLERVVVNTGDFNLVDVQLIHLLQPLDEYNLACFDVNLEVNKYHVRVVTPTGETFYATVSGQMECMAVRKLVGNYPSGSLVYLGHLTYELFNCQAVEYPMTLQARLAAMVYDVECLPNPHPYPQDKLLLDIIMASPRRDELDPEL